MRYVWGFPYGLQSAGCLLPAEESSKWTWESHSYQAAVSHWRWVPACHQGGEGETSTQGWKVSCCFLGAAVVSPQRVRCPGLLFIFVSAEFTILCHCPFFHRGLDLTPSRPQFPSCHMQPTATQGCDYGSSYLQRKSLHCRGLRPCSPPPSPVLAVNGGSSVDRGEEEGCEGR